VTRELLSALMEYIYECAKHQADGVLDSEASGRNMYKAQAEVWRIYDEERKP